MKKFFSIMLSVVLMLTFFTQIRVSAAEKNVSAGVVNITSGTLNVRKSGSADSAVIHSLKKYSYITITDRNGTWWKAEYESGRYGYVHSDYITVMSGTPVSVRISSGYLNVRNGPGTSYSVTDRLTNGNTVIILSTNGEWYRILYHGTKTGYVHSAYVSDSSSDVYPALSLNVPVYRQTDARWSDVKIGSSGKTIGKIGCATTAIAMIESYRTGKTIYPDEMSRILSYSSSGNVYWPSDYTVITTGTDYLAKIYNLLKQGKPVLFGAKNNSGGQHWVVITGYKGSNNLSASGFIINDPGSSSRTTLAQLLGSYPNFYKYFYY